MFRRPTDQTPKNGEEENPFLLSFSDLMASLLAIFMGQSRFEWVTVLNQ
jgi:hypothetical protein